MKTPANVKKMLRKTNPIQTQFKPNFQPEMLSEANSTLRNSILDIRHSIFTPTTTLYVQSVGGGPWPTLKTFLCKTNPISNWQNERYRLMLKALTTNSYPRHLEKTNPIRTQFQALNPALATEYCILYTGY